MLTLWFAVAIGAVVTVALLYVVFRFRAKGDEKHVPEQIQGNHTLEVIWTVIPILILAIVAVPTVKTAFSTQAPEAGDNVIVVKAVGHQWWFEFQYPGDKVTTANEMYIPTGKQVRLYLHSNDVIHSFWVPRLAGKVDMIPGRENVMLLEASEEGVFFGQCAEFCGSSHARMRFRVVAVSPEKYDEWIKTRQAGVAEPTDAKAVAGKAVFEGKANCWACHSIDGSQKAKGTAGPNLSNIGARTTIAAGVLENTDEHLRQWIRNPQAIKPDAKMPPHGTGQISDEEMDALIAYLRSLNK